MNITLARTQEITSKQSKRKKKYTRHTACICSGCPDRLLRIAVHFYALRQPRAHKRRRRRWYNATFTSLQERERERNARARIFSFALGHREVILSLSLSLSFSSYVYMPKRIPRLQYTLFRPLRVISPIRPQRFLHSYRVECLFLRRRRESAVRFSCFFPYLSAVESFVHDGAAASIARRK